VRRKIRFMKNELFFKFDYVKLELLQKNLFESWLEPITNI
jgi:hypothetical protein